VALLLQRVSTKSEGIGVEDDPAELAARWRGQRGKRRRDDDDLLSCLGTLGRMETG
jgi:hypothetical protein